MPPDPPGLRITERFLQSMLPMAVVALDGTVLHANRALGRLLGAEPSALDGSMVDHAVRDAAAQVAWAVGASTEEPVQGGQVTQRLMSSDGSTLTVLCTWTLMRDDAGRPWYITAAYADETERVAAQEELKASEARWRALLAHAADVTWTAADDGTVRWTTPPLGRLGWAQADVVGSGVWDLVHPEDRDAFRSAWDQVVQRRAPRATVECRVAVQGGGWMWGLQTLTDLRHDPDVGSIMGNLVDVSERRARRRARERQEEQFRFRFERSRVPQSISDRAGRFADVNPALCDLLGRSREDLLGTPVLDINHPDDPGLAAIGLRAVLSGRQESAQVERVIARPDGSPLVVQVDLTLLRDEDGNPDGVAGYVHDLTQLREVERRNAEQQRFFSTLAARANDLAIVGAPDGTLIYVSPAVTHVLGYAADDIVGRRGYDLVHPDDVRTAREEYEAVVATGVTRTFVVRVQSADGEWRWIEETATSLLHTAIGGVVCNLRDVTDRVRAETALRASEAQYRAILDTAQEGIWAAARDGRTLYANARMAELLGVSIGDLDGTPLHHLVTPDAAERLTRKRSSRLERGPERYEVEYGHPDGRQRWLSVSASPLHDADGSWSGSLAMVSDVTDTRRAEQRLRHAARHDELTGLGNRTVLHERLHAAPLRLGDATAVLFLDLDGFKHINDSRGHEVGDRLLQCVAGRLGAATSPRDTVVRYGGDEFIVVLDAADEARALDTAGRLQAAIEEPVEVGGVPMHVSASIGIAVSPAASPAASPSQLLRYADLAMYAAKSTDRRIVLFHPAMATEAEERQSLAEDLRAALDREQLTVAYQPVIDLTSGRTVGVEALARWTHPQHGAIPPDRFVPLAESLGLAPRLDRWVLGRALGDVAALRRAGSDVHVAVNLSAHTLADPTIEEAVAAATLEHGLLPQHVTLEITESALMADPTAAAGTLARLRARGFPIAIDDFGTGYSSLAYLRDLPITGLKLDRGFVVDLARSLDAISIAAAIVELATAVGATVVAEGVETADQADVLRGLGCQLGQGWLWSPAVTADALSRALRDRRHASVDLGASAS